jgi:endonuclease/exonuclease/phosphatase family metal-dependent hydrolase
MSGNFRPLAALLFVCLPVSVHCQDTLRIATYNLLNYPDTDATTRNPYFRKSLALLDPDILAVQEMQSQAGVNLLQDSVLNYYRKGAYISVPFHDGYDTDNALFFKPDKVLFVSVRYLPTSLRDVARYTLMFPGSPDTLFLFSLHLKAGSTPGDIDERLIEATTLRGYLNELPPNSKCIVVGDFNTSGTGEPCLVKLMESEPNNNGRVKDPLNAVGVWNNNYAFRRLHTQSTRVRSFGNGANGGLDDRFDLILTSYSSLDSLIILPSYQAFGNDGSHFNDSINRLPNLAVPDSVAEGLHYGSDHLPVSCSFVFGKQTSPSTAGVSVGAGWNLISIPVSMRDTVRTSLFPSALSNAISYENGAYTASSMVRSGKGFWLRFDSAATIILTGYPVLTDTVELRVGWNLVGTLTNDVNVSTILTDPAGILCTGKFYEYYGNSYYGTPTLSPGKAYWIKACAPGQVILAR